MNTDAASTDSFPSATSYLYESIGSIGSMLLAAAALSSTGSIGYNPVKRWDCGHSSQTSAQALISSCDAASATIETFSHHRTAKLIEARLNEFGLIPWRIEHTKDGSILFDNPGGKDACADLYPNGDLIVLIKNSTTDEIHELWYEDTERMIEILCDAPDKRPV